MTENKQVTAPWKLLIVDDEIDIHEITELTLKRLKFENRSIEFLHAYTANEAKVVLMAHSDIAVILLDVVMENDTAGLDLVRTIREDFNNDSVRLVIRTGNPGLAPEEEVTLAYDINDYRGKTELTAQSLRTVIITALRSYKAFDTIKALNNEIDETQRELIFSLGEIAESRGQDTSKHVERVGMISGLLASKLGYSEDDAKQIQLAASMHDIGKMAINDDIINKPGKLTDEEFEHMKKHCIYGFDMLSNSERKLLMTAAQIAYEHHENYDGSGYPRGLKGDEIHQVSRIVAIVDVFDALATKRVYKDAWPLDEILDFIKSQKNIKFDPELVDVLFDNIDEITNLIEKIENE